MTVRVKGKDKSISVADYNSILRQHGYNSLDSERKELIKIGCQLGSLREEDIIYIADTNHSIVQANNRLTSRRKVY